MRPALLLLPGMMLDGRVFDEQISRLARQLDVVVGDITAGDSVETIARAVLARAPSRFALAGLSMGAIVAFEIWRQAPGRVTHLALLGTTPHADRPERTQERLEQMAAVERGELRHVMNDLSSRYLASKNRMNTRLLQLILDMGLRLGPAVFQRQSLALSHRPDSVPTLSNIQCPVLVLCGREDVLCNPAIHRDMADRVPQADLVILADCGHLSPLEEPAAVSGALEQLLRRSA